MALLPPNALAFQYQSGLDCIRSAYRAANVAMEQAWMKADEEHRLYVNSGQDDSEYDEDGILTHSTAFQLQHAQYDASYALRAVREAFITSTFHYWERWARAKTGLNGLNDNFDKLRQTVSEIYPVSNGLKMLNHLNNVLKHNSAYHARQLANIRIDHFWRAPMSFVHNRQESWALGISGGHVDEAMEIVAQSGPTYE